MAWNQPDKNQGAKSRRPSSSSGLEDFFKGLKKRMGGGSGGSGGADPGEGSSMFLGIIVGAIFLAWLATGIYQIEPAERGVVQRFGRFSEVTNPGPHWHLPRPIESVTKLNIANVNSIDHQSRMLTSDVNLVSISCAIQYQYADPQRVLFRVRDPEATLREVSESAIREVIGQNTLEAVLAGEPRRAITTNTRDLIQKTMDAYDSGIRVISVNLTDIQVPDQVQASQRDANKAIEDRERFSKEAQAYTNDLVPKARGTAQRQLLDAEAYKLRVIAAAEGEASRFTQLLGAYSQAPEVTRNRLYVETMETLLSRSRKVLIDTNGDGKGNNLIYLPLDKLISQDAAAGGGTVAAESMSNAAANAAEAADARSRQRGER